MDSVLGTHNMASEILVKINQTGQEEEYIKKFREIGIIEDREITGDQYRYGSVQKFGSDDFRISIIDEANNRVNISATMDAGETWTSMLAQSISTNGRAINSADFVVPYKPGFPQMMVTTYPYDDKHNTDPSGEYPVIAIDDRYSETLTD